MNIMLSLFFAQLLNTGVIENPRIATLQIGSAEAKCFSEEIQRQSPEGLLGKGEVYLIGPSVRRDLPPVGSVIEIFGAAPNSKPLPKYVNLSLWLETADSSIWETKTFADGSVEYRASAVLNPAKVFDRVQYRYLFGFDLSKCL